MLNIRPSDHKEPMVQITLPNSEIEKFCRQWHIVEFALFGSVLREDFSPSSDVDVLVTSAHDARWSLFDLATMKEQLERLFGRSVDLLTRRGVENCRNRFRRDAILSTAESVYVA